VLYITWGTGIGGSFIVKRRLYHSVNSVMGEFGHTPVEWATPRPCYCGCPGCLETEASGRALETRMAEQTGQALAVREMLQRATQGDADCRATLERAARLLARAVSGCLPLLNPDAVIIGGGVSHVLTLVRPAFDEELEARTPWFTRQGLIVALSAFPDDAGLLGASLLPRHQMEES
jgi:predicted NBD/HSP70 family sugar kinase